MKNLILLNHYKIFFLACNVWSSNFSAWRGEWLFAGAMLPDSDDYLSSDDTDMEDNETISSSTKLVTAEKLVAEMDYSLLAVDMQKLLHISRTGVTEEQPPPGQVSRRPSIKMNEMEDIPDHKCSFCSGNFTAKDLLSKHMLRIHHKDVINIFSQYSNTHEYLKCPFCVYKLSEKHKKLFLLHLEKKHSFEFVASIKDHFSSSSESIAPADAQDTPKLAVPFHEVPGRKEPFWNRPVNNSVRRKLQLGGDRSVKVEPSAQVLYLKENAPSNRRIDDEQSMRNLMWKRSSVKQFVCGRCREAFAYNALLLDHINVRHRGPLKLVQPLYHCGLCTATFFKNKFLVRHCFHHHSPQ